MESLTYFKNLKITPKKLRMIRDNIVKMAPQEALEYLEYTTLKSARVYYKVIHSAIHNATNKLKVSADVLQFKLLTVEEGRKLKRFKAGSKGMAKPLIRKFSHIKVILVEGEARVVKAVKKNEQEKEILKEVAPEKAEKKTEVKKKTVAKKAATKKPAKKAVAKKDTSSTKKE